MNAPRILVFSVFLALISACNSVPEEWAIPAVDEANGIPQWTLPQEFQEKLTIAPVGLHMMENGFLLTGDGNSDDIFTPQARGYDTQGKEKWRVELDGGVLASAVRGDVGVVLLRPAGIKPTMMEMQFLDMETGEVLGQTGVKVVPDQYIVNMYLAADGSVLVATEITDGKALILRYSAKGELEIKYPIGEKVNVSPANFQIGEKGVEYWVMTDWNEEGQDYVVKMEVREEGAPAMVWEKPLPAEMTWAHASCPAKDGGIWVAGATEDPAIFAVAHLSADAVWDKPKLARVPVQDTKVAWLGYSIKGNLECFVYGEFEPDGEPDEDAEWLHHGYKFEYLPEKPKGIGTIEFKNMTSLATPIYLGENSFLLAYVKDPKSIHPGYLRRGNFE